MKCTVYEFAPQQGGTFRMAFEYKNTIHDVRGKTSEHADVFKGRFLELIPAKRIVELIEFESENPAFAEPMKITTTLTPVAGGTKVTFICEDVPAVIHESDHYKGMHSTLNKLAAFTE